MPDPLSDQLIARATSWADPKNRPPRDNWKPPVNTPDENTDAPMHQRLAVEDALGMSQPPWNIATNGGLPSDGNGGLLVATEGGGEDPTSEMNQALIRYVLNHPQEFPGGVNDIRDLLDNPDEDAEDNKDQDAGEIIARRMDILNRRP